MESSPLTSSFKNQKSAFINHQFFLSLFSPSRRWRQVGGPRRVSPTSSNSKSKIQNLKFKISSSPSALHHAAGDKWADRGGSALPL
jgi:hypothetical protein